MPALQAFFIALTILAPPLMWVASRRIQSDRFDRILGRVLAVLLLGVEFMDLGMKVFGDGMSPGGALPMQLCDWALFGVAAALWFRSQRCFEVTYFWGLAGTIQALITPAIATDLATWRQAGFFFAHSGIVIGVLFLLLAHKMRPVPRSLLRVVAWSELYLATALAVNALTGENYGFLSHKPATASMLDWFSDTRWLYVVQINLTAFVFFAVLYLPWLVRDWWKARQTMS